MAHDHLMRIMPEQLCNPPQIHTRPNKSTGKRVGGAMPRKILRVEPINLYALKLDAFGLDAFGLDAFGLDAFGIDAFELDAFQLDAFEHLAVHRGNLARIPARCEVAFARHHNQPILLRR